MNELLDPGVLTVIFIFGTPIAGLIAYLSFNYMKWSRLNDLKRDMVQRGMSAEEIKEVVRAGIGKEDNE